MGEHTRRSAVLTLEGAEAALAAALAHAREHDLRMNVAVVDPGGTLLAFARMDGAFADPLELSAASRIGTPGLASAVRQRNVTLVNALGSGILETRALLAFLPRIAPEILGAPLILPNIATWWCGGDAARRR